DRSQRKLEVQPGIRDNLRRRPATLRGNVQPVHAAISRPHGQTACRGDPRYSAGNRHRAGKRGQELALDGRHDDGNQRLLKIVVTAKFGLKPRSRLVSECYVIVPGKLFWSRSGSLFHRKRSRGSFLSFFSSKDTSACSSTTRLYALTPIPNSSDSARAFRLSRTGSRSRKKTALAS